MHVLHGVYAWCINHAYAAHFIFPLLQLLTSELAVSSVEAIILSTVILAAIVHVIKRLVFDCVVATVTKRLKLLAAELRFENNSLPDPKCSVRSQFFRIWKSVVSSELV